MDIITSNPVAFLRAVNIENATVYVCIPSSAMNQPYTDVSDCVRTIQYDSILNLRNKLVALRLTAPVLWGLSGDESFAACQAYPGAAPVGEYRDGEIRAITIDGVCVLKTNPPMPDVKMLSKLMPCEQVHFQTRSARVVLAWSSEDHWYHDPDRGADVTRFPTTEFFIEDLANRRIAIPRSRKSREKRLRVEDHGETVIVRRSREEFIEVFAADWAAINEQEYEI